MSSQISSWRAHGNHRGAIYTARNGYYSLCSTKIPHTSRSIDGVGVYYGHFGHDLPDLFYKLDVIMFLGKQTFEFDTNDRFLLRIASELLKENVSMVLDTPEQQDWARQRAEYFIRQFTER